MQSVTHFCTICFQKVLPQEAPFYLARTLAILNNTKIIKFLSAVVERFSLSTN